MDWDSAHQIKRRNKVIELIKIKCNQGDYYIGALQIPDLSQSQTFKCKKCETIIFLNDKQYNDMEFQRIQNEQNKYRVERIYKMTDEELKNDCKIISTITCRGKG